MTTTVEAPPAKGVSSDDASEPRPSLPVLIQAPVAAIFGGLSGLRRARIFHPVGKLFDGELKIFPGEEHPDVPLFRDPGPHPAAARLSRGIGLPEFLPDVLGLAVKLVGVHGPGRDQDVLMVSSGTGRIGRRMLLPATRYLDQSFSSVLPYRIGGRIMLFGALPAAHLEVDPDAPALTEAEEALTEGALQFTLAVAEPFGQWKRVGVLYLRESVDGADLAFNPWNTGGGIRPAGPINMVRDAAYRGSRRGRPDAPPEQEPATA
jgi:hypothetical protein